ncbi:MAG TPA: hypothetical protein PKC43_00505 [Phycisphaerales bacterium]|nr:hypothetical protein [Phycisphaerales bacterium]HMP35905.1 hypothetical protein [Phycisphaerales bacterium]
MAPAAPHVRVAAAIVAAGVVGSALAGPPEYAIFDLGLVNPGDTASQGFRVSVNGIATGRSFGNPTQAFSWTQIGGLVGLPNLANPARPFSAGNGVNAAGVVVGTGATTAFGASPLPLIWESGNVAQLPLPAGQSLGRANDINAHGVAVGSVGSGSTEFGVLYQGGAGGTAMVITQTTANGSFLRSATAINDAGRIVGQGIDPNNAAVNVGYVLDTATNVAFAVGALPGRNGALAFDVSEAGHVVGSSMLNQGAGTPFIWSDGGGMVEIPLPPGTSQGTGRGVNSAGWVVGVASGLFAVPFLHDGTTTYVLGDLLPPGSGWDLTMNTSSSALGISEDGVIVGTGVLNGSVRAYAMIPAKRSCLGDLNGDGVVDGADQGILLASWGPAKGSPADLDGNGEVDGADLGILLSNWGPCK